MSDNIALGIGLQFNTSTLNQLNQISQAFQGIQNKINGFSNNFNQVSQSIQKTQQMAQQVNSTMNQIAQRVDNIRNSGQKLTNVQEVMNKNGKSIVETYKNIDGTLTKIKTQYDTQNNVLNQSVRTTQGLRGALHNIGTDIAHNIGKMMEWAASAAIIYGTMNLIKQAFQTIAATEVSTIHVQRVLPTGANIGTISSGAKNISQTYGEDLQDTFKSMEGWSRKFKDVNDVVNMTNASMRLIATTDIDLEKSFTDLSAIMTQFGQNAGWAGHEVDVLNELSNNLRTTAQDVAEGLAKMGSASKMMGVEMERSAALVAVGVETTGASGEEIGTSLNKMLSRFHAKNAIEALGAVGINSFQPISKSLDELGLHWKEYTQLEQEAIAKSLGGVVQWQKVASILQNYNRVIEATLLSYNSFGSAQREIDLDMSSFQKKSEQLRSSLQVLSINVGNGVLPIFKNLTDGLRLIISYSDGIIPKLALMGGAIWGVIAAYQAWKAAAVAAAAANTALQLSAGVILGIAGGIAALIAIFVGWANSSNKVADAMTRLGQQEQSVVNIQQRGNQIKYLSDMHEQLYQKLQRLTKGTQEYNETLNLYRKVQSQLNQLGTEFNVVQDQSLTKYEGEKKQINLLIDKIAELDKKRQQAYENELKRQIKNIQPEFDNMQKLMDLKAKYYQVRPKVTTDIYGALSGKPEDIRAVNSVKNEIQQWIANNPSFNGWQKLSESQSAKMNMTEWLKNQQSEYEVLNRTLMDLQAKQLGLNLVQGASQTGTGAPPEPDKPTINEIFTTLSREQVEMIKKIGQAWEQYLGAPFKKDTNIYTFQNGGGSMTFDMSSEIRDNLDAIFKPLSQMDADIRKAISDYNNKIQNMSKEGPLTLDKIQGAQLDVANVYDKYIQQLDESKFKLIELTNGLDKSSNLYKYLAQAINMIDVQKLKLMGDSTKWQNLNTVFTDVDKKVQEAVDNYKNKMDELSKYGPPEFKDVYAAQQSVYDVYKKQADQLEANKVALQNYLNTLSVTDPLYAALTASINSLDEKKIQLLKDALNYNNLPTPTSKDPKKKYFDWNKLAIDGISSLGDSLKELGGTAGAVGNLIQTAVSSVKMDTNGNIDFAASGTGFLQGIMGQVLGGLVSFLTPVTHTAGNYVRDRQQNYANYEQLQSYRNFGDLQNQLTRAEDELHYWDSLSKVQLGLNSNVNQMRDYWQNIVSNIQNSLADAEKIREAFGVAVNDMAGALENSLQATNYADFLSSWSKNLEDVTRQAIIKAFMASANFNSFYQNLSDKIWNAISDNNLTSNELADIKNYSHSMDSSIKSFYDVLNQLGLNNTNDNGSSNGNSGNYVAGTNQPIVYNNYINLYAGAFSGDRSSAQTFLYWIRDGLQDIEGRA